MGKGQGKGWGNNSFKQTMQKIQKMDDENKVYVEGLPDGCSWKDLQKHFGDAGHKSKLCEVMRGGKGVLVFDDVSAATEAITVLDQTKMKDKVITCDVWTKKEKSPQDQKEGK